MKHDRLLIIAILCPCFLLAQPSDSTLDQRKVEKVKKGWNLGALPVIGYNSDIGFQYGALANFYNYGNGSIYPKYFHSIYMEISRTTKGSGINQIFYDSEHLLKGLRITADMSFLTEKALDFYGFNGFDAVYNADWTDDLKDTSIYRSRLFYKHERKLFRFMVDFQGKIGNGHFYWLAGLSHLQVGIGPVDIQRLNKGKSDSKKLPDIPGLYDKYVEWGLIDEGEKDGGGVNYLKLGFIYDSRDNEPNPMQGMWSEVLICTAPRFLINGNYGYTKLSITHRQYFTLIKDDLSLAYRLAYQGTLNGRAPFYMQPYLISSFSQSTTIDGMGGARTLRGMLRNRVVGDGEAYGNLELRWKFYRTYFINQNFYFGLNAFIDAGQVVDRLSVSLPALPINEKDNYFVRDSETMHYTYGFGLRVAMNQNFIVAADYGLVGDKRDGSSGVYINLGYLF
ncbi:MAG: Omp85 family outer membrane protein [Bacteroidales bacterium]